MEETPHELVRMWSRLRPAMHVAWGPCAPWPGLLRHPCGQASPFSSSGLCLLSPAMPRAQGLPCPSRRILVLPYFLPLRAPTSQPLLLVFAPREPGFRSLSAGHPPPPPPHTGRAQQPTRDPPDARGTHTLCSERTDLKAWPVRCLVGHQTQPEPLRGCLSSPFTLLGGITHPSTSAGTLWDR